MSEKLCDLCDDSTTAVVCCQLEDLFLCLKHQKIHLDRTRTKEHVLETFSERESRLQSERSEEYNQQLSKLSNSLKVDLSNRQALLLHAEALKIHEQMEVAVSKTKEDILRDFQNIRDSFSNRNKELIKEFESIYAKKKDILKSQIQQADRFLEKLQSFKDVTLEVIPSSQNSTMKRMVDARKAAQACIAEVVIAKAEIYPKTHPDLFFVRDDSILDHIKKIGQLETREAAAIKCVASGSGLSSVNASTGEGRFTITLLDRDGIPCLLIPGDLEVNFLMENKDELDAKVEVKSAKRGSVDVMYKVTLNKCSSLSISVKIKGVHVCGSPFTVISKVEIEGRYIKHFGGNGSADGLFSNPWGVEAYQGEIYITDYGNNRIQVFDADGKFVRKFGGSGSNADGLFRNPEGICVFYGEVFVCDYNGHQVQVFSTDGRFLRRWGSSGNGEGQLSGPIGVSVSEFGFVYVAESGNNRISVFTSDGLFMNHIGTSGSGPGNLSNPWNVTVDKEELFITEYGNCRISVFALDGTFLRTFGTRGAGDGNLQNPEDCLVYGDRCYVCDFGNNRISVFSRDGIFIRKFGSHGSGEGQFMGPLSMAILDGRAYVAEYYAPQRIIILE